LRTKTVELFSGTLHRPGISYAANKLLADAGSAHGFKADKMANIIEYVDLYEILKVLFCCG
jgi:hypothetical protein